MNAIGSYRPISSSTSLKPRWSSPTQPEHRSSGDQVTLSATSEKRDLKKMGLFGGIGAALGVAAVALCFPAAGVGAMVLTGVLSGVGGAAIADGALETAGTGKPKPFDPYNPNDVLDPDNLYHPRNPFNPWNFAH